MAIRFEIFLRHFVARIPNQFFFDVPLHVCADVCHSLTSASQWRSKH